MLAIIIGLTIILQSLINIIEFFHDADPKVLIVCIFEDVQQMSLACYHSGHSLI